MTRLASAERRWRRKRPPGTPPGLSPDAVFPRRSELRPSSPRLPLAAPASAPALWALLFAAASAYWAAGGTAGAGTVATALAERAAERDPGFVATLWATAALKAALAALALSLTRPRGRILRFAGWATGVALTLYGAVGLGEFGLMALGVLEVPADVGPAAVTWYLLLWEPVWLLGGLLFLAAVRAAPRLEPGGDDR
jgi:hypothetical protein